MEWSDGLKREEDYINSNHRLVCVGWSYLPVHHTGDNKLKERDDEVQGNQEVAC